MDKYFKESDVMAVLNKELMYCPLDCEWLVRHIIISMSSLKPADVKHVVKGEWEDCAVELDSRSNRHDYQCPKCGYPADYFICGSENWWCAYEPNFCPNCGADMRPRKNLEAGAEYADADTIIPAT